MHFLILRNKISFFVYTDGATPRQGPSMDETTKRGKSDRLCDGCFPLPSKRVWFPCRSKYLGSFHVYIAFYFNQVRFRNARQGS